MGAVARRLGPSFRTLLFGRGGGAVCEPWTAGRELVWEPLPGGSVRPSGPCCFAVARAPFVSLDGWKRASFLVGSESNVRQWERLPGGSVRPSGPCCLGVAEAPFVSLGRLEDELLFWEPLPGGSVRPSGPCCFAVARAPFVSLETAWKSMLRASCRFRHCRPLGSGMPLPGFGSEASPSVHHRAACWAWRRRRL